MAKAWLRERWTELIPVLASLSADQEEEIAQRCAAEVVAWKERPSMKSLSSLKEPMTDTRNEMKKIPLTEQNSYMNLRTGQREHLALKYLNYSEQEWAEMNRQSEQRYHERQEHQQLLDHPDQIVAKADVLLGSTNWTEVVVGLAVVTGRRLAEILKVGELYPKTLHTVDFKGQLKRKDEVLKPYEIPVLVEASRVLAVWSGLRKMIDCSGMETEAIGKAYSEEIGEVATRHFAELVPVRDGRDKLFAHLFRAVYPRLAVYYFCPISVSDIAYVSTILGHYWSTGADEVQQRNYASSLHYFDYKVGNGAGNIDGRQGIRLGDAGVEVLEVFRPKPAVVAGSKKKEQHKVDLLGLDKKKDHSLTRIGQATKSRIDQVQQDLEARTQDEALSTVLDEHYVLKQIVTLLSPLYEQLGTDNPVGAVQALLGDGGAVQVDQKLAEHFKTSLVEVIALLDDAAHDSGKKTPAEYLRELVAAKRTFKQSYEKRHQGKDYSKLATSKLRKTKMPGAAEERFRRAVVALMHHNETVSVPEFRRYINPALITDLVGGRPSDAKEYLATRQAEIEEHHKKYSITPGYNRLVLQSVKIEVPEWPEGVTPSEEDEVEEDTEE